MATLITGAGIIGTMAALQLLRSGERATLYDLAPSHDFLASVLDYGKIKVITGDILDKPHLISTIRHEEVDRIIHTAGLLGAAAWAHPFSAISTNIGGTAAVLEAARLTGVKRVVFTSTLALYGTTPEPPSGGYAEDYTSRYLTNRQRGIYPITKLASEQIGLAYADHYGVDFVALRLAPVFGLWKGKPSGTVAQLMDTLIRGPTFGKPAEFDDERGLLSALPSGGFDLLYSKDAAKSTILACFASRLEQKVYNISMGKLCTVDETIAIIKRVLPNAKITVKSREGVGPTGFAALLYPADITAARKELGYEPEYDLEMAIRDYADGLRKYQSNGIAP